MVSHSMLIDNDNSKWSNAAVAALADQLTMHSRQQHSKLKQEQEEATKKLQKKGSIIIKQTNQQKQTPWAYIDTESLFRFKIKGYPLNQQLQQTAATKKKQENKAKVFIIIITTITIRKAQQIQSSGNTKCTHTKIYSVSLKDH